MKRHPEPIPAPRVARSVDRLSKIDHYIMRRFYRPGTPFGDVFSEARLMVEKQRGIRTQRTTPEQLAKVRERAANIRRKRGIA